MIEVYTDGALKGIVNKPDRKNPDHWGGSWAFVIINRDYDKEIAKSFCHYPIPNVTSDEMEILGFFNAVSFCVKNEVYPTMYVDCSYIVDMWNGWLEKWNPKWLKSNRKPVKNMLAVNMLFTLHKQYKHLIKVEHVKGHDGNKWNEYADKLAGLCFEHAKA